MNFKSILLFLLLSTYAFGETLYTWGYGDILGETLIMIKYVFQVNTWNDLWKLVLLISTIVGTVSMIFPNSDPFKLPKIMIIAMGVTSIFVTSKIDIYIDDKVEPNYNQTITNVPWAVGYPFAMFSQLEKVSGELYENMSSIPSALNYSNAGFFSSLSIFKQSQDQKIIDPRLFKNMDTYILECAMPDFENGFKDFNSLTDTDDIWTYLGNTSPSTIAQYTNADDTVSLITCDDYYTQVNTDLGTYVNNEGLSTLGQQIGLSSLATISTNLQSSHNYLLGATKNAVDILKQNVAINMFNSSFKTYSLINGTDSGSTGYYASKGEAQVQANMIISGILGSKYVPITKGILTSLIAGLTPAVALLMLTPIGLKSFIGYLSMLTWLSLWHIGDVLLNHIITIKAQSAISALSSDITIKTQGIVDSTTLDYINMASSMYWMIPTISLMMVTGLGLMTLSTIGGGMTARVARGEMVATEMASGNANHGNISTNNTNSNKFDMTKQMNSGVGFTNTSFAGVHSNGNFSGSGNTTDGNTHQLNNSAMNMSTQANSSLSQLAGTGAGQGVNFNNATGGSRTSGNQTYYDNGTVVSSANGTTATLQDVVTNKDANGTEQIQRGTVNTTFGDDSNIKSRSTEYSNGQVYQTSVTDKSGTNLTTNYKNGEATTSTFTSKDGQTSFTFTTGDDGSINPISGKIAGVDIKDGYTASDAFSSSVNSSAMESFMKANGTSLNVMEQIKDEHGTTTGFTGAGQIALSAKGGIELFGTGGGVKGQVSGMKSYDERSGVGTIESNGKSYQFQLSGSQKDDFERRLSETRTSMSDQRATYDQAQNVIANQLNSGQYTNSMEAFNAVAYGNKQDIFDQQSANINNGVQSQVLSGTASAQTGINTNNTQLQNNGDGALHTHGANQVIDYNKGVSSMVANTPMHSVDSAITNGAKQFGVDIQSNVNTGNAPFVASPVGNINYSQTFTGDPKGMDVNQNVVNSLKFVDTSGKK